MNLAEDDFVEAIQEDALTGKANTEELGFSTKINDYLSA